MIKFILTTLVVIWGAFSLTFLMLDHSMKIPGSGWITILYGFSMLVIFYKTGILENNHLVTTKTEDTE